MGNCEVKIPQNPTRHWLIHNTSTKHDPHVLSGFTEVCWSTLSGCRVPPVRSARTAPKPLVAWKRIQAVVDAPPANFRRDDVGHKRQGRLYSVGGPSQVEECRAGEAAIASEPIRMHSRSKWWTNRLQKYRILAWRSPPMAIADVHHTCHIGQVKCTRINIIQHLRVPSSHVRSEAENA